MCSKHVRVKNINKYIEKNCVLRWSFTKNHYMMHGQQNIKESVLSQYIGYHWREGKKRTSKKNVDGRSTSSHDNKKFRTRSVEKQRGMAFGFRKTATALVKPDR